MSIRGTYALLLYADHSRTILIGALGAIDFPSGWYLYLGSAFGPGGLDARLARHWRRTHKRFHWHIDYLRAETMPVEAWTDHGPGHRECAWATAAAALPTARVVAPRFGASDCRCPSHLFHYEQRPKLKTFASLVQADPARVVVDDG